MAENIRCFCPEYPTNIRKLHPTGVFGKESELDKMVDSHSMAGPFDLIPSQNVFKSQACTADRGATMRLSILGYFIPRILYGGGVMCVVAPG
jgi:hypothetical protein